MHEADLLLELAHIQAESIGWKPLDQSSYLDLGFDESEYITVIEVVSQATPEMQGSSVLWLF